jgi:hypothetical protein
MNTIKNAAAAILRAAKKNPMITAAGLRDELAAGDIGGWLGLPEIAACNFSDWSAAMGLAAKYLDDPAPVPIIEIEVRTVYGNTLIYPVNEAAKTLAKIAGKKTLSADDIKNACALGLEVVEINKAYAAIAGYLVSRAA